MSFIRARACCSDALGLDRQRIHHHPGFEFLYLTDLRGLLFGFHVAVKHADASRLCHGDRHLRLGHGVHGRGDDRDVDGNRTRDVGADIDIGGQHLRQAGLEQHVVECEPLAGTCIVVFCGHCQLRLAPKRQKARRQGVKKARCEGVLALRYGPLLGWRGSIARDDADS